MKTLIKSVCIILISFSIFSCKTTGTVHNSQNSLDWDGVYKASFIPVTGEEQVTTLKLNRDLTYVIQSSAVGKTEVMEEAGTFTWNKEGSEITLNNKMVYKVGENTLTKIREKGKKVVEGKQNVMRKM